MATKGKLSRAKQIDMSEKLASLPRKESDDISTKDFVAGLKNQIEASQKKGYSLNEISLILRAHDIPISAATLRTYLQKTASAKKTTTKKGEEK